MKQEVTYTELQQSVEYFLIDQNKADVIVNKFIEEVIAITDGIEEKSYKYEMNAFSVNPNNITKEMIENNIEYYLNLTEKSETIEEKVFRLESENEFLTQCILEISGVIYGG